MRGHEKIEVGEKESKNDFRVIYIDAFKNDYCSDPLEVVAASILNSLTGDDKLKKYRAKFQDLAASLITSIALRGIEYATNGSVKPEDVKAAVVSRFQETENEISLVENFKSSLEKIGKSKKTLVIIDELDRCRPDFALKLIERVKHVLDAKNIQFLLVSNREVLEQNIASTYGYDGSHAQSYMQKFFDLEIDLPFREANAEQYLEYLTVRCPTSALSASMNETGLNLLKYVASRNNFSLRTIQKIWSRYLLLSSAYARQKHDIVFDVYMTTIMMVCILSQVRKSMLSDIRNGTIKWDGSIGNVLGIQSSEITQLKCEPEEYSVVLAWIIFGKQAEVREKLNRASPAVKDLAESYPLKRGHSFKTSVLLRVYEDYEAIAGKL